MHLKTEHVRQLCNAFIGLPTRLETALQVGTVIGVPQSPCVLVVGGRFHHSSSRQLRHVVQWAHMIYSVSMLHTNTAGDCSVFPCTGKFPPPKGLVCNPVQSPCVLMLPPIMQPLAGFGAKAATTLWTQPNHTFPQQRQTQTSSKTHLPGQGTAGRAS